MPSQFFGLMIGYSGLTAAQASQNTTANNIANINTEGYSRQHLKQEAANALRTYTHYGMAGAGVDAKTIDQIRDEYIDINTGLMPQILENTPGRIPIWVR